MYDPRDIGLARDWKQNAQSVVDAATAAQKHNKTPQLSEPEFDYTLFKAIWCAVQPWGLGPKHARAIYDVVKAAQSDVGTK